MTAELSTGSIACPNCGAVSDEPCTEWCATADPRFANRTQKLYKRSGVLTDGRKSSCTGIEDRLPSGVARPSVSIPEHDIEF